MNEKINDRINRLDNRVRTRCVHDVQTRHAWACVDVGRKVIREEKRSFQF